MALLFLRGQIGLYIFKAACYKFPLFCPQQQSLLTPVRRAMHFPSSQPKTLTGYLHLPLYQWLIISRHFTLCQMLNDLIHIYRHAKSHNLASQTSCDVRIHKIVGCSWQGNGRPPRLLLNFVGSFNDNWETLYQRHGLLCIFKWKERVMERVIETLIYGDVRPCSVTEEDQEIHHSEKFVA